MATVKSPAGQASAPTQGSLYLSGLAGRYLAAPGGQRLGRLSDVILRLCGAQYPPVTGLVAKVGRRLVFVPAGQIAAWNGDVIQLIKASFDLRKFERRDGEVLLRADVQGHRLIDVDRCRLVRATDLRLSPANGGWVLDAVDTRRPPLHLPGLPARRERPHAALDWREFEPLIGHAGSAVLRGPFARIRHLKPAQIADLLEDASKAEGTEILGRVHVDPELEADVFEELDQDLAARLLGARTNSEIAAVLTRMRADDAADAIADLPQGRRQPVLDLLPPGQRVKVTTLMGFNPSSAGGLMCLDFLALPGSLTVSDALAAVARSPGLQPEALASVHALDGDGRLAGVSRLVTLVQADPDAELAQVCDANPVRIGPDTDVTDVAVLMTDYNLTTIPVVDGQRRILGLITVDDVLETTLPDDWRQREAARLPDARHGDTTAGQPESAEGTPGSTSPSQAREGQ
jgi:CBS domain-containing protein